MPSIKQGNEWSMLSIKGLASLLSILLDYDEIPKFKNPISSRAFLHAKSAENYARWLGNLNAWWNYKKSGRGSTSLQFLATYWFQVQALGSITTYSFRDAKSRQFGHSQ